MKCGLGIRGLQIILSATLRTPEKTRLVLNLCFIFCCIHLVLFVHVIKKDIDEFVADLGCLQGFWNWSWDDLVKTDLPTMLQHVYNSSQQQIYYVGYSQVCVFSVWNNYEVNRMLVFHLIYSIM